MGCTGCVLDLVHRVHDVVERSVRAHGDLSGRQVIADGRRDADHRDAQLRIGIARVCQFLDLAIGLETANRNDSPNIPPPDLFCDRLDFLVVQFVPDRAQFAAAKVDPVLNIHPAKIPDIPTCQSAKPIANANDILALVPRHSQRGAQNCVHAGRIGPPCHDGDAATCGQFCLGMRACQRLQQVERVEEAPAAHGQRLFEISVVDLIVDVAALCYDLVQGCRRGFVVHEAVHHGRFIRSCDVVDRRSTQARCQIAIKSTGRPPSLYVPQHGHASLDAHAISQDLRDCVGANGKAIRMPRTLCEDDDIMPAASLPAGLQRFDHSKMPA